MSTAGLPHSSTQPIERIKALHQYYRDCLSQPKHFPNSEHYPTELIEWVTDRRNTDVVHLAEYLHVLPAPPEVPPEHDLAFRLMMFAIVQANLASDYSNRYPDFTLPPNVAADIKRGVGRVLELHPASEYIATCVQLLYRIKEVEEVLALAEAYPDLFASYAELQAIVGFIHTMLGDYEAGSHYLAPLAASDATRHLPLVGLALMTCQYFRGLTPELPVSWERLHEDTTELPILAAKLPEFVLCQPLPETPRPVVFAACDTAYFFAHALHLAYSIHATNAGKLDLHLHLYSPTPAVLMEIDALRQRLPGMAIGVSVEYGAAPTAHANTYYATVRFVRAWQLQQQYRCALILSDVDALFNGAWDDFVHTLPPQTELLLARPRAAPFWENVLAGFIYCQPTVFGSTFLAKVAQFILHNIELGRVVWFTDQIALAACDAAFASGRPEVHHIDASQVIDLEHKPDTLCWMVTTRKNDNPAYNAARARLYDTYR
jgi:hypothetical protein